MSNVTLVRIRSGFANRPDAFEVFEAGRFIDELREETATYSLPPGYSVSRSNAGDLAIYDATEDHCEISMHSSGWPQLVSLAREMPVLQQVD